MSGWITGHCSRTGASVAALPLAPAAECQYRWTDLAAIDVYHVKVTKVSVPALVACAVMAFASPSHAEAAAQPSAALQLQTGPARGLFGALWVMPLSTHEFQGAGLEVGYCYGWFAPLYRAGFVQNGYEPISGNPVLALERTRRWFLDLEIDAQIHFRERIALSFGAGVSILDNTVDVTSMNGFDWATATHERWRVRPLLGATLAGPLFQASVTANLGADPEVHVSAPRPPGRRPGRRCRRAGRSRDLPARAPTTRW